jgi:hypothetical protein
MRKTVIALAAFLVSVAVSCGETQETRALCSHTAELESSLVATGVAIDNFASISPRQLQSTVAVLTGTLSIINDIAPSSVKADLEQTIRSYEELSVALQNVYWDGTVAETDQNVQNAVQNLSRNDNVDALDSLRAFVKEQCKVEISQGINATPGDDQSIGSTSVVIDPQPDLNYGFDKEETAIKSYAYFIASQRGLTISEQQALCLGELMMNVALDNATVTDAVFDATLDTSLKKCSIDLK